ncbi:protease [Methanosarcina mazei]|uniref:Protease n=1 Tax=Methanosarcina mazei TaxID=2209 RepID=A0A0F8ELH3_METMZ|nr:U32 family peptidase [Methanosarcina mazei]KKG29648.1 protease [Methanosarcina mazei]KKG39445.1 protease [Methanosarcina mazei]KKG41532.1 protease [Methanosarcina mazei]KKG45161.1 protease [Methanosarcina mazei]KKG47523.1 protease [Methanosarcina mazei]
MSAKIPDIYAKNLICTPPEILSPAGDHEGLLGAIKGGADAVYLGIGEFNARQGAKNFTIDDLEAAVDLAHSHGVRVYLALNIPLKQKELQHVLDIVDRAYAAGIDAVILQDLGLLRLLNEIYPDLSLHASTQMTIHNKEGVDFVAGLGAKRVIVSRELTTAEVKDIVDNSGVDIEVFVHGALCYSYSGKCLFSSFLHDRSANRGACAQPCRRRYRFLVNGREIDEKYVAGSYPISCAELSTLTGLEDIIKTGVVSLKIEGRMKKPEYVTASAAAYKAAVEKICTPGEKPTRAELEAGEAELAKLFYRGFTRGFILGEKGVSHSKYSSNYGAFLGKVLDISRSRGSTKLTVRLEEDIQVKDGISIFTRERMLGSAVTRIVTISGEHVKSAKKGEKAGLEISSKTGRAVQRGDELYLTTDTQLLDALQKAKLKTLPVSLKVKARKGEQFTVEIRKEDKKREANEKDSKTEETSSAEFADDYIVQGAEKAPTTEEQIKKAMESLGDTPFEAVSVEIEADENIFIPVGVLKNTRRKAAKVLLEKVLKANKKEQKHPNLENFNHLCTLEGNKGIKISDPESKTESGMKKTGRGLKDTSKKLLLSVEVQKISSLLQAATAGADIAYIPVSLFEELMSPGNADMLEDLKAEKTELVFMIPRVTHDRELEELKPLLEKVRDAGFTVASSSLGASQLAKKLSIPFVAQKDLNIFNAFAASTLYQAGAYRTTISSELNLSEIKNICDTLQACGTSGQTEILVYGRELMLITENDLLKPLVDRKIVRKESEVLLVDQSGSEFPVRRLGTRTLIYNSKILDMLKYVKNMRGYGVDVLRLDLSLNTDAEVKEIIEVYKQAIAGKEAKLKPERGVEYTTGHYFKGV